MSTTATLERRFLQAADRMALRQNVKFDHQALESLKPIIRTGVLKLEVMDFAEDESRIEAAESNLLGFVRALATTAKGQSLYKISAQMIERAIARSSVWPFS